LNGPAVLRRGDRGEAVRELSARLAAMSALSVTASDLFDAPLEEAVRAFQDARGLRVDGICGPETWGALIESGFQLGDRLLYLTRPMLRGDDVAELQRRLNALGFDAGREDGILGPETENALRQFQRNAGTTADGVCGPASIAALERVSGLAAGSIASVREREALRRTPAQVRGMRVSLVTDPGLAELGHAVARALQRAGAIVGLDTSGDDPSAITGAANLFHAGAFLALTGSGEPGYRCAYFASRAFRSEGGSSLAQRLTASMRAVLPEVDDPIGRTYRFLRETRMPAVVCELVGTEPGASVAASTELRTRLTEALVEGFRRGVEEPALDEPGRDEPRRPA
jgi:N-acetylmuramoyl-L-alanine amidase